MELHEVEESSDSSPIATTPTLPRYSRTEELMSQSSSPGSGTHVSSTSGFSLGEAIVQSAKQGMETWYQLPAEDNVSQLTAASMSRLGAEHTGSELATLEEGMITVSEGMKKLRAGSRSNTPQLEFQDSHLSPTLPLLAVYSTKGQSLSDDTFFQRTELDFAPLRESPDVSGLSERFTRPLQISDAVQLAATEVSTDFSLSQHPLAIRTACADDASSVCSLSQHTISPASMDEADELKRDAKEELFAPLEEDQHSKPPESQPGAEYQNSQARAGEYSSLVFLKENMFKASFDDDATFLDSSVPAPLLMELLEKEVGLSSSGSSSHRTLSSSVPQIDQEVNLQPTVYTDNTEKSNSDANPAEQLEDVVVPKLDLSRSSSGFSDKEIFKTPRDSAPTRTSVSSTTSTPRAIEKSDLNESRRSELSNITTRSWHGKSDEEISIALRKQLCSEILQKRQTLSGSSKLENISDPQQPTCHPVTPNTGSLGTYSGKDSTIVEVQTGLGNGELTASSGCSFERGYKESDLSSSVSHTTFGGSFLRSLAQPVSQSTPGVFPNVPRATVRPATGKLTPVESKHEVSLPSTDVQQSVSSKITLAPSINKDLIEPAGQRSSTKGSEVLSAASLCNKRKVSSLPTLNYIEKVGAWNVTQTSGKTTFDNLALCGFTGVSPKKKAFSAIADSLNQIFSRQNSGKSSPQLPTSQESFRSPRRNLAASFSGGSTPATEQSGSKEALERRSLSRSLSCTSVGTARKQIQQAGDPQTRKNEGLQNAQNLDAAVKAGADGSSVESVLMQVKETSERRSAHVEDRNSVSDNRKTASPSETASPVEKDRFCSEDKVIGSDPKESDKLQGSQPSFKITIDRFSDVSPSDGACVSSREMSRIGEQTLSPSTGAVSAFSPSSLEVDNYAPYWATNPTSPAKSTELNFEERIPVYLRNLGIDQSPSAILNPFAPRGPIREPEFSMKGSICTPTKSVQQSEGGSPMKGDFSQSSIFSINSTLSMSIPMGSDIDSDTPVPAEFSVQEALRSSIERPVSQCSLQTAFHPLDRSLDVPPQQPSQATSDQKKSKDAEPLPASEPSSPHLNDSGNLISTRVKNLIDKFESSAGNATSDSLPSSPLADKDCQAGLRDAQAEEASWLATEASCRGLDLRDDSFVGSKTLQEIRKLLGEAENVVSGRSSFSSLSASLKGSDDFSSFLHRKLDSFQDSFTSTVDNKESESSLLWRKSSSESMLTLDGLKDSSRKDSSLQPIATSHRDSSGSHLCDASGQICVSKDVEWVPLGELPWEAVQPSFTAKTRRRSEPEGCSEAIQKKVAPTSIALMRLPRDISQEVDDGRDLAQELAGRFPTATPEDIETVPKMTPHVSDLKEGEKVTAIDDSSSVDSLAARVATLLKDESPATMASSIITEADEEERKARDWMKLKLAEEQPEPLELGKEDRLRIEEIKTELLQNTKNKNTTTKAQWTTDSDSDATSSGDVHFGVPAAGVTRQFLALNAVKHQISSQMQKLTSNPFDTSVERCTPLRRDRDALLREIAQREGVSGVGAASRMAIESNKPIASITFSSRKQPPSTSVSCSPHISPEVLHLRQLSEGGSNQSGNERDTELERRQARSLHTMPGTLSDCQGHSSSPRVPTNANSHRVSLMQDRVPQHLAGQVPEFAPRSDICKHSNTLRGIALSQQDELDAVQKAENRSGIDRFVQEPYSGYGFCHHQDPASQKELKLRLSEESAWNRQVDQEKDDFTPATEIIPLPAPEHRLLRSPMKHGPEKSATKQMSRSTPNLSLIEKATVEPNNMESSAAPLQISSFASGTSSISSPTKKVLSYVHVTLSPRPVNGKSTSAENQFRFENSHHRLEDNGANFYPETRSLFPCSSRMPTPQWSSDVQGAPYSSKAVSTIVYGGYSGVGVDHELRTALNSDQSVQFSGQRSPLVLQNESTKQEGKKTSIPTQTVRTPSADAMTQITTHVPDKSLFASETTMDAGHSTRHHISTTPPEQLHRMSHISPNACDQASDQPVLLPYKPQGSHAMFYVPHPGSRISPVRSDTTIESSHPGSDDAIPPKFTAEVLGSRDKEIEIDITTRHKEGIYSKRALPTTVWEENEMTPGDSQKIPAVGRTQISEESQGQSHPGRHHQYIENPEHMQSPCDLSKSSTTQHSGSSSRGTHQSNEDLRREVREFSIDQLDFSRDLEDGEFAALRGEPDDSMDDIHQHLSSVREDLTSTRTGRHWTSKDRAPPLSSGRVTTASHRTTDPTSDRSLRSSRSLHKLWEKFKERQRQEPVDSKEYSLLERLDRLSRLLNNPVQHSILSVEENEQSRSEEERNKSRKREESKRGQRDKRGHCMRQAWVQKFLEPEGTQTSIQTKDGISFRSSSTLEPIREISTERIKIILNRQKDPARKERDPSFSETVSETDTAVQTESGSSYQTDTGSTLSTIDTARLIRAFGPERVTLNPSLSKLYSTIDKQRDSLEQKGQRRRAGRSHGKPAAPPAQYSTEESTMTCDSVSTASTYSLPAPRGPSSALTNKKAVKLVSKSIQAGDLEIVNSATKKNTRDVGMTFPSPNLARAVHMQAPSNPDLQPNKMDKKTQDFLYEKTTKRSNRQRHPRGVCWFVPADDLKSESKKENQPSSEPSPGSAWFAPLGYTKRWREPLREKHMQEQLVNRILEQPIANQAISNKGPRSFVRITLQEALEMRRPDFVSRSRERMKRLELHAEERRIQSVFNSERENLFNNPTTKTGWRATNPDQQTDEEIPMVQRRRTVSKKEMFTRSKQMYSQLPEIRHRREEERRREEYKSYRLKAALYKKKITNHVLGRKTPWQ
ncbi:uncharacterized protein alms1 isoform X2 [Polyodon spathula]|uniref:uncharacterized protein alms1 isoform X2 n=1 Tax=Polyodon spathula TaxID=7913 RepID=UPI001B7DC8E6|nr:uncharacterized protein alms1 isoform X2 [Polyodon spathula]